MSAEGTSSSPSAKPQYSIVRRTATTVLVLWPCKNGGGKGIEVFSRFDRVCLLHHGRAHAPFLSKGPAMLPLADALVAANRENRSNGRPPVTYAVALKKILSGEILAEKINGRWRVDPAALVRARPPELIAA